MMKKTLQKILLAKRECRSRLLKTVVWVLNQIRDAENDDKERYAEKLESFDTGMGPIDFDLEYMAIEGEYLSCEHSLNFLESAIEDLNFAY